MKISFVTTNSGKFAEISEMLAQKGHETENISTSYPEIQANSLEIVVIQGLQWLMERYDRAVLIDDSGLFIDALGEFPGVYSSYVFKKIGCKGILQLMQDKKDRNAHFECCLGFMERGKEPQLFKGISNGIISESIRGEKGFGFDPIFIPTDHDKTFSEMSMEQKNRLSHRGKAIEKFLEYLR